MLRPYFLTCQKIIKNPVTKIAQLPIIKMAFCLGNFSQPVLSGINTTAKPKYSDSIPIKPHWRAISSCSKSSHGISISNQRNNNPPFPWPPLAPILFNSLEFQHESKNNLLRECSISVVTTNHSQAIHLCLYYHLPKEAKQSICPLNMRVQTRSKTTMTALVWFKMHPRFPLYREQQQEK